LELKRGGTRSHCSVNVLWKRLWAFRKTDHIKKKLYTSGLSFAVAKAAAVNRKESHRAQFRVVHIVPELQLTN